MKRGILTRKQYRRLVTERVQEASTEPVKLSKGGKQVLAFMVLQLLRLGEFEELDNARARNMPTGYLG